MSSFIAALSNLRICPAIVFALAQGTINHCLLLRIQGRVLSARIPLPKLLLCALCSMTLHILPLLFTECLLIPGILTSPWMFSLLMFVNPLSAVAYYFAVKGILRFSPTQTSIFVRNMLLTHYAATLGYLLQINLLHGFIPMGNPAHHLHIHNILASLLVIAELIACIVIVDVYHKRAKRCILIPPNYADKHITLSFAKTYAVLTLLYGGVTITGQYWKADAFETFDPAISLIYLLLTACGLIFFFYSMSKLRERLLNWEIREKRTYIQSLQHINQEFREIKHDFYNVLQTYSGFIELEDYDGLRKYHEELFHTTRLAGDFLSLIDALKNRIVVYSLLKSKAELAQKAGVAFCIHRVCDIASVMLSDIDLSRVLNIVLDNAIEAARHAKDKQVNISFEHKDPGTFLFVITNTTAEDVDVTRIFESGYTTKDGHTGIGLSQVAHILGGYDHCMSRAKFKENRFTLQLTLAARQGEYQKPNIA